MERETKEIELKYSKKKVVVRAFLTEKENRELMRKMLGDSKVVNGEFAEEGNKADELIAYKDAIIDAWVISVDGETNKINEILLEIPAKDYAQVIEYLKSLVEDDEKKSL